jgi:hypothetical protein
MDLLSRQPAKLNPMSLKEPYWADPRKCSFIYLFVPTGEMPRARYLHLVHLGKQIAQKGSIAPGRHEEVAQALVSLLESLTEAVICNHRGSNQLGIGEAGIPVMILYSERSIIKLHRQTKNQREVLDPCA